MAFNPEQARDELGRWAPGGSGRELTTAEAGALEEYSGTAFATVNGALRGAAADPKTQALIRHIDSAFEATVPLSEDAVLHRGMGTNRLPGVGETFSDRAFVSTTVDDAQARIFAEKRMMASGTFDPTRNVAVVQITVPKGSRVINMSRRGVGYGKEKEVLLPRNSTFHVTKRETQTMRGPRSGRKFAVQVVHVELVR